MMNREIELESVRRYLDGTATREETDALEARILTDAAFRGEFLRYAHLDAALAGNRQSRVPFGTARKTGRWPQWRPLTAAAAGIVFGMLCTSVVFGYMVPQMTKSVTLLREGFEDDGKPRAEGFPTSAEVWGGDAAVSVRSGDAVQAKEGERILRMEPTRGDLSNRQHLIIALPPLREDEAPTVRVTASFHASDSEIRDRYLMRAATFSEAPGEIDPMWMHQLWGDESNRALSAAAQARTFPPGAAEWQTMHLTIDVPPGSRVLVVSLWAATMDGRPERRAPHYLDDIQVTLAPLTPAP